MLVDTQRIPTVHGDTLDEAATMLREEIATLPLTARVTSLASGRDAGTFSGMAVVDLISVVRGRTALGERAHHVHGTGTTLARAPRRSLAPRCSRTVRTTRA